MIELLNTNITPIVHKDGYKKICTMCLFRMLGNYNPLIKYLTYLIRQIRLLSEFFRDMKLRIYIDYNVTAFYINREEKKNYTQDF